MRKLFFDEAFDGGVFNGRHGVATAGESWVGPLGALGSLESLLGLTHKAIGAGVRVGEALRGLSETSGFWDKSLEADGLATAREMLRWSDTLKLHGWKGQGTGRLEALAKALKNVSPGLAERLERVKERLSLLTDVRFSVTLYAALESLPKRWREVLSVHTVVHTELSSVAAPDLQLIRPYGQLVAADVLAAALAATLQTKTLIIGGDPVLDAALRRHGLPTTGAAQTPHDNVLGEILPLIIELGLSPADPQRALELLAVPAGPIRPKVARALLGALQQWPAVGSPEWKQAVTDILPKLEDDATRKKVKKRLTDVFAGTVDPTLPYPTAILLERSNWMMQWLQGRLAYETNPEAEARLQAVVGQVALFKNLVDFTSAAELSMTQVRRFLEEAHNGMSTPSAYPKQAGLHSIGKAGGVVAPIDRIVWWNYTRSSSPTPRPIGLSKPEIAELAAVDVILPTAAELSRTRAARAQRPFAMAAQSLWLISPQREINGDEATPHPSWDEVVARVSAANRFIHEAPVLEKPLKKTKRAALALPGPVQAWKAETAIARREKESPSSVESLLSCSLKWALNYVSHFRSGATAQLPTGDTLLGKLAHYVLLEKTLTRSHDSAKAAADYAVQILVTEGPAMAAPLFLPGAAAERGQVEHVLRGAAEALHNVVASGWKVAGTELHVSGTGFGTAFGGDVDLIVERDSQRAVIDLKWSGQASKRALLEDGTALQLAAYSALLAENGHADAPVAYFILTSQSMLSADPRLALDGTALKTGWSPERTWQLVKETHETTWGAVSRGELVSPGVVDEKHLPKTGINGENALLVKPPCHYCELDGICGRRYGRVEVADGED